MASTSLGSSWLRQFRKGRSTIFPVNLCDYIQYVEQMLITTLIVFTSEFGKKNTLYLKNATVIETDFPLVFKYLVYTVKLKGINLFAS